MNLHQTDFDQTISPELGRQRVNRFSAVLLYSKLIVLPFNTDEYCRFTMARMFRFLAYL